MDKMKLFRMNLTVRSNDPSETKVNVKDEPQTSSELTVKQSFRWQIMPKESRLTEVNS